MPSSDDGPSEVIGAFLKSATELVAAYVRPYGTKTYAHLRILVPSAEEEGAWVHTKKGIGIQVDQVPALRDGVRRLLDVAAPNKVVATLPAGKDQIRVLTKTFKGEQYLDVRRFFSDKNDEWQPTQKGVTVHAERLSDLVDLVDQLEKGAESFS